MTPAEAQKAYDEAVPIPLSQERIDEIVDFAVSHYKVCPHQNRYECYR